MADPQDPTAPTTMGDLKSIKTLIGSAIDTKFLELQNLILQLKAGNDSLEKPALEDYLSSGDGDTEEDIEKKKRDEVDKLKNSSSASPASKTKGKEEDYDVVSHGYSPDPQYHIFALTILVPHLLLIFQLVLVGNTQ